MKLAANWKIAIACIVLPQIWHSQYYISVDIDISKLFRTLRSAVNGIFVIKIFSLDECVDTKMGYALQNLNNYPSKIFMHLTSISAQKQKPLLPASFSMKGVCHAS